LCPNCLPEVQGFIRDKSEDTNQKIPGATNTIEDAIKILKENHYVVYPVVATRNRKKASSK